MPREAKQNQIIDAAARIFSQKGFHQAKMDDIAALANVAKGTLYYNFASKSELFGATVTRGLNRIMAEITENLDSDLPFPDHFRMLVSDTVRLYITNKEVTRIHANEMSRGIDESVRKDIAGVRKQFVAFIEDILRTGEEKGYLKPLPHHLSAVAVVGVMDALCAHHLADPSADSQDCIIDTVVTLLSTGLVAD